MGLASELMTVGAWAAFIMSGSPSAASFNFILQLCAEAG